MVGCKWIYRIKTHINGSIEHYKTHLVAKGFTQEYRIDYEETFTPIAQISFVHALLAIVVASKWDIFQMDVKNTFHNGNLSEKVICNLLLVSLLNRTRFVTFDMHFMA